jgi:hypothetical protein
VKCFVIPVIIAATGIVSKGLKISGNNTRTTFNRFSTKKTAILGTSHIIRKVLQSGTGNLSGGVHCWLKSRSAREEKKL